MKKSRTCRILIWHFIRAKSVNVVNTFNCLTVASSLNVDPKTVRIFFDELVKAGVLEHKRGINGKTSNLYWIPQCNASLQVLPEFYCDWEIDRIWKACRTLRTFGTDLICSITQIPIDYCQKTLKEWSKFGVLRLLKPASSGRKGSFHHWQLINDLGVGTPIVVGDRLLDSNSGNFLEVL